MEFQNVWVILLIFVGGSGALQGPYAYTMVTLRTTRGKKCVSILLRNFAFIWNYSVCLLLLKLALAEYATNTFNSKQKYEKLAVVVHVHQTTQNLVISRCCFADDGKEMYQELSMPVHSYCFALQIYFWWRSRNRCRRVLRKVPIDFPDLFAL